MTESADSQNGAPIQDYVVWQTSRLSRDQRELRNRHKGRVVWLTGLPGSGKSTIAYAVEENLHRAGLQTVVLDGDNLRHGLCVDLGFSIADRNENVRRAGEVAKLFLAQGTIVLVALVSPIRDAREKIRQWFSDGDFSEIYCDCPSSICRQRDPKGLYEAALRGAIPEFTGISSPYEAPLNPALVLNTGQESVDQSVIKLTQFVTERL
jgi:adenylylsulfate kinase